MLSNLGWIAFVVCMIVAGYKVILWSATFPAELPKEELQQTAEVVPMRSRSARQEPRRAA
ncbi:MAG: hypothetical protein IKZ30_01240 [Oscillospiraceae bacterium]|nr:hypothetical protein [Oscillospiraceae bacterium]